MNKLQDNTVTSEEEKHLNQLVVTATTPKIRRNFIPYPVSVILYVLCCVASLPGTLLTKFGYGLLGSKITHWGSRPNAQAN